MWLSGSRHSKSNTVASSNTTVGYQALHSFATGPMGLEQLGLSTAVGFQALANATGNGAANSAFGYQALMNGTDGAGNIGIGLQALFNNTGGSGNIATGNNALLNNQTGGGNTAIGSNALITNTAGDHNTAIGLEALNANTGSSNIGVGEFAGGAVTTANNVICIGTLGANVGNSCYISNIFGQPGGSQAVFVSADGKLGAQVSSRRFKEEIKPMDRVSEALYALNPVAFRYKKEIDPTATAQLGLGAEDVEKVTADLVIHDKGGKPYSVRYDQVNAMLLNESLKEHKAFIKEQRKVDEQGGQIQEQQATIAELKKEVQALVAHAKEQDLRIQKVSAQVESATGAQLVSVP